MRKKMMIVLIISALMLFLYAENNMISITKLDVSSSKIPESFKGYKIVHLSDFHNRSFWNFGSKVERKVKELQPHIIVVTGDLIDSRKYKEEVSLDFMKELVKIAPVYYVNGNHEARSGNFKSLEKGLKEIGVKVLRNESTQIMKDGEKIYIVGIDDPEQRYVGRELQDSTDNLQKNDFKILLAHRPELIEVYNKYKLDLVFSGHAHGGQVRLPFIGGLIAPGQGIFPKYTSGKYDFNNTTLIVSRGLGNSLFPQRLFNRPEIIQVTCTN